MIPALLTVRQVAAALSVGRSTVYRLIQMGELDAYRVSLDQGVRISEESVHRFLERRAEPKPVVTPLRRRSP